MRLHHLLFIACFLWSASAGAQDVNNNAPLSKNAPADRVYSIRDKDAAKKHDALIAPYVAQAKKTLPQAKKRFLSGLKPGEAFFLTTRLTDGKGRYEQVFVRITSWQGSRIAGEIASDITVVEQYHFGQPVSFDESRVLDWLITHPDGSEEGNYVGKFLDSQHQ